MSKEDLFHLGIKAIIRNKAGEILLLKVNPKKLSGTHEPYWDIPGGRIERGHSVEETLRREVEEELGVNELNNITYITTVLSNIRIPLGTHDVGLLLAIYSCELDPTAALQLSDEHTEMGWFTVPEAIRLLGVKYPESFTQSLAEIA